jgi:hypothetical protein
MSATAKAGEQHKDNNNNITKYLELKKDRIVDLAERNYENLVETLTNDSISSVAASSLSNHASSLPQSSSRFQNLSDQSDIYGIEKSESFHNDKGNSDD